MITSGTTAITTNSDTPVVVLPPSNAGGIRATVVTLVNEGAAPGFYSIDGGISWARLPAGPDSVSLRSPQLEQLGGGGLQVKRVAGGADLAGIWGSAY